MTSDNDMPANQHHFERYLGPWSRRDLMRVGSLGISSAIWPGVNARATAAELPALGASVLPAKARSVIFLWMAGGVTHHDSLDPKPEAPEEIRGTLSAIATA